MSLMERRAGFRSFNVWPGWVDALSSLLMVVIFVLMVFVVSQFYMSNLLTGQEALVARLTRQVGELSELLTLERGENAELRGRFASVSDELQQAIAVRDALRDSQAALTAERDSLAGRLNSAEARAAAQDEALTEADRTIRADRETIALRLSELASLRADLEALRSARQDLETQVAALALALRAHQAEAERLGVNLEQTLSLAALLRQRAERAEAGAAEAAEARGAMAAELERQRAAAGQAQSAADEARRAAEQQRAAAGQAQTAAEQARTAAAASQERLRLSDGEIMRLRDLLLASEAAAAELREQGEAAAAAAEELQGQIAAAEEQRAGVTTQLRLTREERDRLMAELTALRDRSQGLEARVSTAEERTALAQREVQERNTRIAALTGALGQSGTELDRQRRLTAESQTLVAQLNAQIAALREELARASAALDVSEARVDAQRVQIGSLNARLNQALIRQVEELQRYRSEFFGRLRAVLGQRPDVSVVGDRFVFQSEVLFPSGSAVLEPAGREQLAGFARTLLALAADLPPDIDWVLRVDGHTDRRPIRTAEFASNWELSTARAVAVVRFLAEQGVPARRLAAAGFGEFQPLDPADTDAAYQRNRRIELMLDQR